jgi:hypothetical protein
VQRRPVHTPLQATSGSRVRHAIRLGLTVLAVTVVSAGLAGGTDRLLAQTRRDPRIPLAIRRVGPYVSVAVRSGVPTALAWGLGAGPLAGAAAAVSAGSVAMIGPRLSVILLDRAEREQGRMAVVLGASSAFVFLLAPIAGALVGGLTSTPHAIRPRGQQWGLTGGFSTGLAGACALTLSWMWSAGWSHDPAGAVVFLVLVGFTGGLAGVGGVRLGRLVRGSWWVRRPVANRVAR